jgi:hypothetical protein
MHELVMELLRLLKSADPKSPEDQKRVIALLVKAHAESARAREGLEWMQEVLPAIRAWFHQQEVGQQAQDTVMRVFDYWYQYSPSLVSRPEFRLPDMFLAREELPVDPSSPGTTELRARLSLIQDDLRDLLLMARRAEQSELQRKAQCALIRVEKLLSAPPGATPFRQYPDQLEEQLLKTTRKI